MRRILYYLVGIAVISFGWRQYRHAQLEALGEVESAPVTTQSARAPDPTPAAYHCDGRTYCSQMHSCEEATWFLQNCPGMKMDGDNDGIPCEKQWCGRR